MESFNLLTLLLAASAVLCMYQSLSVGQCDDRSVPQSVMPGISQATVGQLQYLVDGLIVLNHFSVRSCV